VNIYVDADVVVAWEKGTFDFQTWIAARPTDTVMFPPTVWQQLLYGTFAWEPARAQ
jgi:hypothetical protein